MIAQSGDSARIVAVCNQKGGVGKTTVTANLAAELAEMGHGVLVVDADPQANATALLGLAALNPDALTLADALAVDPETGTVRPGGALIAALPAGSPWPLGLRVVPAERKLANREQDQDPGREFRLRTALDGLDAMEVDVVLIDCPPSLGQLTVNALAAAHSALLVTEPAALSVDGLGEIVRTLATVRAALNPGLTMAGVVVNRHNDRRVDRTDWLAQLREDYGRHLIEPPIPEREVVRQAASRSVPLSAVGMTATHPVRLALRAIAERLLERSPA